MLERAFDWIWIIFAAIIILMIAWMTLADAAECQPSVHAARAVHPKEHISWIGGCYFAGYPAHKRAASKGTKMPRPRPDDVADRIAAFLRGPGWQEGLKLRAARIECENASSALMRTAAELREKRVLNERLKEWFAIYAGYRHVSAATRVVGSAVPAREVRDVHLVPENPISRLRPDTVSSYWVPAVYSR